MRNFDVIVIGGGHAGCEAAGASARCGAITALVTNRIATIGEMSCNPAIGGLGKGHLVREIDALDGLMPRAADAAAVQFRVLNRRKGPAVQGPRAQADRSCYRRAMQALIGDTPNLSVIEGEAARVLSDHDVVQGLELADGRSFRCLSLIITTGTFLRGVIHLGDTAIVAGRFGEGASLSLAQSLGVAGLNVADSKQELPRELTAGRSIGQRSKSRMATTPRIFFPTAPPLSRHPSCRAILLVPRLKPTASFSRTYLDPQYTLVRSPVEARDTAHRSKTK